MTDIPDPHRPRSTDDPIRAICLGLFASWWDHNPDKHRRMLAVVYDECYNRKLREPSDPGIIGEAFISVMVKTIGVRIKAEIDIGNNQSIVSSEELEAMRVVMIEAAVEAIADWNRRTASPSFN